MKTNFTFMRFIPFSFRAIVFAVFIAAGAAHLNANETSDARKAQLAQARVQALHDAAVFVLVNSYAEAEGTLAELSRAEPGSAEWHLDVGRYLMRLTIHLSEDGWIDPVKPTARRALVYLQQADRLARNPGIRARAHNASGYLYERFLGDLEAAKASYRLALAAQPAGIAARQKLERIESGEEMVRLRAGR